MYDTNENTVKSWLNYGRKNMRVILETLQKQNKSFLGIAIVPFFIWMFSGDIERATTVKAAEIAHTIILSEPLSASGKISISSFGKTTTSK